MTPTQSGSQMHNLMQRRRGVAQRASLQGYMLGALASGVPTSKLRVRKTPHAKAAPKGSVRNLPAMSSGVANSTYAAGPEGFLKWVEDHDPALYMKIRSFLDAQGLTSSATVSGLGDDAGTVLDPSTPVAGGSGSWADALKTIVPTLVQGYNQQRILSLQIDRAKQGMPPLDLSSYTGDASIKAGLDSSSQKTLLIVAGILAAALVLPKLLRG